MAINTERVSAALQCIPPDLPRTEWVNVAMAVHAAALTVDDLIES
jgi:hypothetical protein